MKNLGNIWENMEWWVRMGKDGERLTWKPVWNLLVKYGRILFFFDMISHFSCLAAWLLGVISIQGGHCHGTLNAAGFIPAKLFRQRNRSYCTYLKAQLSLGKLTVMAITALEVICPRKKSRFWMSCQCGKLPGLVNVNQKSQFLMFFNGWINYLLNGGWMTWMKINYFDWAMFQFAICWHHQVGYIPRSQGFSQTRPDPAVQQQTAEASSWQRLVAHWFLL